MRDVAHDAEVVRDEEVGEPSSRLQVGEQVQHLRLDRDVERGHGLVGDDQRRIEHQRARDRDPLPLAAREHVRIAHVVLGPQPDLARASPARARPAPPPARSVLIASGASRIAPIFLRGLSEP